MFEQPQNPIESSENTPEKIDREQLIAFAKERPPQDPEVHEMLVKWLIETEAPEEADHWEKVSTSIMHLAM